MESLIGKMFGPYQIVSEIGRGGMAIVYKAHQRNLDRFVAIKVLPPQLALDTEFVRRFQLEARAAAKLKHANIVTIHDVGEQDGLSYIVEEFVEGATLADVIRQGGAIAPARVVSIISQVASALDYAHALGYIHRDVKPSNVMIGANDHATLTDFGIVKAAEGTRVTKSGMMMGTAEYMAPEQIRGAAIDARADVYALGIVCYEMLAGRVPFQGDTARVLYCHVQEPPPSLRLLNPRVPPAIEQVVGGALAKDPAQRYASAGEFARALNSAAAGAAPILPRAPEAPTRAVSQPSRNSSYAVWLLAGVAGAALLLVLLLAFVYAAMRITTTALAPSVVVAPTTAPTAITIAQPTTVPAVAPAATAKVAATSTSILPTLTPVPTATPVGPQWRLDLREGFGVFNLFTNNRTPLTLPEGNVTSATWSPDGKKILLAWVRLGSFATTSHPGCDWDSWWKYECENLWGTDTITERTSTEYGGTLRVINPDGSGRIDIAYGTQETPQTSRDPRKRYRDALWSPDGQSIAVSYRDEKADQCVFIIGANGVGMRKLDRCEANDHPRFWSIDGKWVIVWNENTAGLFALSTDGRQRVPLAQLSGVEVYDQRYSPWKITSQPACKIPDFWGCE